MPKRILNRALELWRKSSKKQRIAAGVALVILYAMSGLGSGKTAADNGGAAPAARKPASKQKKMETYTNSIGMKFVRIPAGKFIMGCDPATWEDCRDDAQPRHKVTISRDFWLGQFEVTQAQWEAVMGKNPSQFKGADLPVDRVRWTEVQEFIEKLNEKEGHNRYRLPTEAEWEYAARAGSDTVYFFGDDPAQLDSYAWCAGNAGYISHPVGQKEPNPWGLYDIYGSMYEWVQDWYDKDYYKNSPEVDPQGPEQGGGLIGWRRVVRGGYRGNHAGVCGSAYRDDLWPDGTDVGYGFRVAMTAE